MPTRSDVLHHAHYEYDKTEYLKSLNIKKTMVFFQN